MDHLNDEKIRGLGVGLWYYAPDTDSFELCEEEQMDEVDGIVMPFKEELVSFSDVLKLWKRNQMRILNCMTVMKGVESSTENMVACFWL